jgi:glucosamine kinase
MSLFLGLDIGGSKTDLLLGDESGNTLARSAAPSCALSIAGEAEARKILQHSIAEITGDTGNTPADITRACVGLAGISRIADRYMLEAILRSVVPSKIDILGDMEIAFESAFPNQPGLVIMAGTGSIAYGRNERGDMARAGGWGPAISDEGSGAWIGRLAVSSAMRAIDTGQTTALVQIILHEWSLGMREEVAERANRSSAADFARLFPLVLTAAESGDIIARDCLTRAATELSLLAKVAIRRLWPGRQAFRVAVGGGVFSSASYIRQVFQNSVIAERQEAVIVEDLIDPVLGAYRLALANAGERHNVAR